MNISKRRSLKNNQGFKAIRTKYLLIAFCFIFSVIMINFWPGDQGLRLYFIDVGQGDCIVVKDHQFTFMIDGGGDRFMDDHHNIGMRVVYPFLLEKGIRSIDCVFVTHVHYDHIKGVIEILDLVDIKTIVLPKVYQDYYLSMSKEKNLSELSEETNENDDNIHNQDFVSSIFAGGEELFLLEELVKKANNYSIEILFMDEGEVIKGKSSVFTCVYPYVGKTYSEHENENSLVLKLELGSLTTLFTGDIEEDGEKWLVNHSDELHDVNILKVPHHGSNSSSTEELLLKTDPELAIVCVGENLFGHPSDIVMMRYKNLNIPFYSTKKYGMIEVLVEEDYYKIEAYKGELINESITRTIKD